MARRSFRDRFFTPPVARAMMSPLGILLAGAGAAVGIVAGLPIVAAAGIGAAAWGARVAAAVPRDAGGERIDPFTLDEPWRRFVNDALQARRRFDQAVRQARGGPLRDSLNSIGSRIDDAVRACWRVANQGQAIGDARKQVDARLAAQELAELEQSLGETTPDPESVVAGTLIALRAQLASARRMDDTISRARDQLRLLDARLDEAVARAFELAATTESPGSVLSPDPATAAVAGLGEDVEGIVGDMEALRLGLEEIDRTAPGSA